MGMGHMIKMAAAAIYGKIPSKIFIHVSKGSMAIMLTSPCNVDPLITHFYTVKIGSRGV